MAALAGFPVPMMQKGTVARNSGRGLNAQASRRILSVVAVVEQALRRESIRHKLARTNC